MGFNFTQKILTVCILALFAFITLPREYYTEDLVIHIPVLTMRVDASSFSSDYFRQFHLADLNPSIYYPVLEMFYSIFSGYAPIIFDVLRFFYLLNLFLVLLLLSRQLQIPFFVYVIFTLLLTSHIQIGGSGISIIESEFISRGVGLVLVLYSYYFWLTKKYKTALLVFTGAIAMHGMTAFFAVWIGFIGLLYKYRNKLGLVGILIIISNGIALWIFASPVDPAWLSVLRIRNSYAFIDSWSTKAWINLGLILAPGLLHLFMVKAKSKWRSMIVPVYVSALLLLIVQFFFTTIKPIYPAIVLQLGRIWLFPALVSLLALAHLITLFSKRFNKIFVVIGVGIFVLLVNNRQQIKAQTAQLKPWFDVQAWARNNTNQRCIFLVPFFSKGFRVESKRSIIGEYKDGTLSFYSRDFALEWVKRFKMLQNWEELNSKALIELANLYHFDYFVLAKEKNFTAFPIRYSNDAYVIQSITDTSECEQDL